MKSTKEQLESRGFAEVNADNFLNKKPMKELLILLKNGSPLERTLSARIICERKYKSALPHLCLALQKEKKLYSKIEICNTLSFFGTEALPFLTPLLGKIGNNQHKAIPSDYFKKNSYPLPRDIVARTIIRIGADTLPFLIEVLKSGKPEATSEAIDAIGYITFYERNNSVFSELTACYKKYRDTDLIKWKLVRAMSGSPESKNFLKQELTIVNNQLLKAEIERVINYLEKSSSVS